MATEKTKKEKSKATINVLGTRAQQIERAISGDTGNRQQVSKIQQEILNRKNENTKGLDRDSDNLRRR